MDAKTTQEQIDCLMTEFKLFRRAEFLALKRAFEDRASEMDIMQRTLSDHVQTCALLQATLAARIETAIMMIKLFGSGIILLGSAFAGSIGLYLKFHGSA